jgi:hypothetical protein
MRAIDAMFVWTPDRGGWKGRPLSGQIAVTVIPEARELKEHPCSAGACDHDWREADDKGRQQMLQRLVSQWLYQDEIPIAVVRAAVTKVDEFRDFPFSTKKPKEEEPDREG